MTPRPSPPSGSLEEAVHEMGKRVYCLHLELEPSIANDVQQAFDTLADRVKTALLERESVAPAGPPRPTPTRETLTNAITKLIYEAAGHHETGPPDWLECQCRTHRNGRAVLALLTPAPPQSGEKQ